MRRPFPALLALLATAVLCGCGGGEPPKDGVPTTTTPATSSAAPTSPATPTTPPAPTARPGREEPVKGIDASHHQGPIDWRRVADHGITFAYLKASEGTGFVDPRFAAHRRNAARAGIAVGGYHYFQLCSDGTAQAAHFADVLGDNGGPEGLTPAVDLELAGSCDTPPQRGQLLAEVRAFLAVVEERFGATPVVYLYPEFEDRFRFARELARYPQWVRRLGRAEPRRPWHIWQYDDSGSVPGIAGGVDLNLMGPA
ncbi:MULTISPECIES: glycoside hydrolase family 25 protein [Nocardioides]|uniref:Glycoside hydrolase family 25 protein n=1 Tax=Nocardioides vastitatis TaxID=2568655 RepID=A0ABW0ZJX9_9ACTN|nr:GH25 family lysozyme [Nocardioides sp.]THJ04153.1 lysozyme [Nocardioides sp.]